MTAIRSILGRTEPPTRRDMVRALFQDMRDVEAAFPECDYTFRREVVRDMMCQFLCCDLSQKTLDALIEAAWEDDPQEREGAAERAVEWAVKLHRSFEMEAAE